MGKTPRRDVQIKRDEPHPSWVPLCYAPLVFQREYEKNKLEHAARVLSASDHAAKILSTDFLRYRGLEINHRDIKLEFDIRGRFVNKEPADEWYKGSLSGHPLSRLIMIDVEWDDQGRHCEKTYPPPVDLDSPGLVSLRLDGTVEELLVRAREVVWLKLANEFDEMVLRGYCHVLARADSPLEPKFTEIPALVFVQQYEVVDWIHGTATAGSNGLYDIHIATDIGDVDGEEVAPPGIDGLQDVRVASEPTHLENRIWDAIEAIDPKLTKFSRAELFQKIGAWCKEKVLNVPSEPVFKRAIRKLHEHRIWDAIEAIGPEWTELSPTGLIQRIGEWCKEKGLKVPREPVMKSAIKKLRKTGRV